MAIQDFISLFLSLAAVALSIITFYLQRIRKTDRLAGSCTKCGWSDVIGWRSEAQYSLSNLGDTQLAVTNVVVLNEHNENQPMRATQVPLVLRPNDMVILTILYDEGPLYASLRLVMWVTSASGKTYELIDDIGKFKTFDLKQKRSLEDRLSDN